MLKTMPLKEVEPQQNALRLFALNDADDDVKDAATETLKDAATETLAKLTEAMEAKEAEDELATKEAQELTRTRTEEISEKEAKQVLINAHARSGPRPRLPPLNRRLTRPPDCAHLTVTHLTAPPLLQRAEAEDKLAGGMQTRRNETASKMEELQTCAASKHPTLSEPCTAAPQQCQGRLS